MESGPRLEDGDLAPELRPLAGVSIMRRAGAWRTPEIFSDGAARANLA